jgi:hypothetical protein
MNKEIQGLRRSDLMSLEEYAERRNDYRKQVMAHKKNRQVALGPNSRLYFEDRITMQYQIQEILRIEKIFESAAIEEELDSYNPLIPDGSNWKATFMIEFADENERKEALCRFIGIETCVWVRVGDLEQVYPIANEDLERQTASKTSAVHFLRFELDQTMIESAKNGVDIYMGVTHPEYTHETGALQRHIADSLAADLSLHH